MRLVTFPYTGIYYTNRFFRRDNRGSFLTLKPGSEHPTVYNEADVIVCDFSKSTWLSLEYSYLKLGQTHYLFNSVDIGSILTSVKRKHLDTRNSARMKLI